MIWYIFKSFGEDSICEVRKKVKDANLCSIFKTWIVLLSNGLHVYGALILYLPMLFFWKLVTVVLHNIPSMDFSYKYRILSS